MPASETFVHELDVLNAVFDFALNRGRNPPRPDRSAVRHPSEFSRASRRARAAIFPPRRNRVIHPVTRAALGSSRKTHALHFKFPADKRIQIHACRDDIPPRDAGRFSTHAKLIAKFFKDFRREKGDLTFVIVFEVKETVAFNSPSCDAIYFRA
jgi:hypothetical protein